MAGRQGLYEEDQVSYKSKLPFSHSSSCSPSSSSSQHKGLMPLTYHQHQRDWLENQDEAPPRCYNAAAAHQLELMMDSSPQNCGGDDANASDDHVVTVGDTSPDALGGGSSVRASAMVVEREHMFDKVVTPSDVGKLNRLVIPKQHAERYFPLDSSTNEKGLLLNFEDRNGKPWRFRYSYWNSSQSYVMTKGWSRFVKEKKLDAGDIVSFQRGVGELGKDRLFIDWGRRPDAPEILASLPNHSFPHHNFSFRRPVPPRNPLFLQSQLGMSSISDHSHLLQPSTTTSHPYSCGCAYGTGPHSYNSVGNPCSGSVIYFRSTPAPAPQHVGMVQMESGGIGGGDGVRPVVFESVPVVQGKVAAAKRLRLFGVNLECPISESDECDHILSSTAIPQHSTMAPHPPDLSSSAFSSSIPSLKFRPYNATPLPPTQSELPNKGKASMSLDLDI
ncbi:unnamed protein product [Ilex paraguariensis]|uniref:TF-B3 domain-containing protein n=1 Tax=Ilex paraguariensis TaxID=185542 RepID=A0ABC8TRS1_9AQUA